MGENESKVTNATGPKTLSTAKIWLFAVGQLGWAIMSGLIGNFLVSFYQPDASTGYQTFFAQGTVVLGILTVVGVITAFGRVFDAFTDPWIASMSDKCKHKDGRRIPFLRFASLPLALTTVLVFWAPVKAQSWINIVWVFVFVMGYYVSITAYCTPYNALIAELGHTQKERLTISTAISLTFIVGTAVAYVAPTVWGIFEGAGMDHVLATRVTFSILAVIAFACMLVPTFTIKEKDYVEYKPSEETAVKSLVKTFKNKDFRVFVASDIFYWIGLTMFQTGLIYFVTILMKLPDSWSTVYFVGMTALSLVFYVPINMMVPKLGKKKMVMIAFGGFTVAFLYTAFIGTGALNAVLNPIVQGFILVVVASFPMAIFGILPQAIVADVAMAEAKKTGENRSGMFFAARTFAFKLGQSIAMLLFTALITIGTNGMGYRIVAGVSACLTLFGGLLLLLYNERKVNAEL